jgi:glycine/D-amino acid oxidase-like deaminating enzyme
MVTNGVSHAVTNGHSAAAKSDGLNIVIIGAGIGGLTAAIFLRRQGHRVTLLEQSRFANEVGAAMHLAPNANGILRRLGIFAETIGANVFERVCSSKLNVLLDVRHQETYEVTADFRVQRVE